MLFPLDDMRRAVTTILPSQPLTRLTEVRAKGERAEQPTMVEAMQELLQARSAVSTVSSSETDICAKGCSGAR
jgi:hypothetical protein